MDTLEESGRREKRQASVEIQESEEQLLRTANQLQLRIAD